MYMVFFFVFGIFTAGEQTDHLLPDLLHAGTARALSLEDPQPPWIVTLLLCVSPLFIDQSTTKMMTAVTVMWQLIKLDVQT